MGWPESDDSQYLWREGGAPAREAYANVAKAISQFEPLYMIANPGTAAENARKVPCPPLCFCSSAAACGKLCMLTCGNVTPMLFQ